MNKDKDVNKTRISTESYSEFFIIYKLSEEKTEKWGGKGFKIFISHRKIVQLIKLLYSFRTKIKMLIFKTTLVIF